MTTALPATPRPGTSPVAGVILAPDGQWNEVEGWMRGLVIQHLGEEALPCYGRHFAFHAKDLWHGSGSFPRDKWPLKRRMDIFDAVSSVPKMFGLPVVYGYFKRGKLDKSEYIDRMRKRGVDDRKIAALMHASAFTRAASSIDQWMIENTSNEVVMMIAEDVASDKKSTIDAHHALYVDRAIERVPGAFHAERIVEQVSFMRKDQSGILQLADMCAFVLKRKLQGCQKILPFFENLKGCVFHRTRGNSSLATKVPISELSVLTDSGEYQPLEEMVDLSHPPPDPERSA